MVSGEEVRAARKRKKMSIEKLAELMALSESTIRNWEKGRYKIDIAYDQWLTEILELGAPSIEQASEAELLEQLKRHGDEISRVARRLSELRSAREQSPQAPPPENC